MFSMLSRSEVIMAWNPSQVVLQPFSWMIIDIPFGTFGNCSSTIPPENLEMNGGETRIGTMRPPVVVLCLLLKL